MTVSRHLPFSHPVYGLIRSVGSAADSIDRPPRRTVQTPVATAPGFSCTVGRTAAAVVVRVRGGLDAAGGDQLGVVLGDLIEGHGNGVVVVDLGAVTTVGRAAVKVLAAAADSALRRGARLIVVNASGDVRAALNDPGISIASPVSGGPLR